MTWDQPGSFKLSLLDAAGRARIYRFECTCGAAPEQYDVYEQGPGPTDDAALTLVGYVRFRHGILTLTAGDPLGPELLRASFESIEQMPNPYRGLLPNQPATVSRWADPDFPTPKARRDWLNAIGHLLAARACDWSGAGIRS